MATAQISRNCLKAQLKLEVLKVYFRAQKYKHCCLNIQKLPVWKYSCISWRSWPESWTISHPALTLTPWGMGQRLQLLPVPKSAVDLLLCGSCLFSLAVVSRAGLVTACLPAFAGLLLQVQISQPCADRRSGLSVQDYQQTACKNYSAK